MTNKTLIILIVTIFTPIVFHAQINQPPQRQKTFMENVRFGGGIGLSFGDDFFSGSITPFALYEVNSFLMTGAGLNFTYSSFNDNELLVYGASLIAIGRPVREIQLSLEFEQLRVNRTINNIKDNYWYPALFVGAGYNSGPVTFGVRYDVLYDSDKSIYANAFMPFVRVFF